MNVSVVDLSANQKKLQVEIPAEKIQGEIEGKYRELAKHVRIKGFRPGKAPRSIIKSYYGKSVEMEVSSEVIKETFPEALRKTDLKPLVEADVSETHFADNGSFTYTAILDVCPPFELEGYKGLKVPKRVPKVTEEQEEAELRRLREQHAQLKTLEVERPVGVGDVAVVDFVPWLGDSVFEKGRTTDFMAEIGKNTIHPDFDEKLIGRNIGESFSFELDYPEDAPTKEIAGKRVRFEVSIKEIKEKIVPDLNDEFAKSAGDYETIDDLRRAVQDRLMKHEEAVITSEVRGRIVERLLEMVDFELSSKVVDREIDFMIANLLRQFESQGIKIEPSRFDTPEVRADYRGQAVRSLKQRLILQRIAQIEDIKLTDEDRDEIYRDIARLMRTDAESVRKDYAESPIVQHAEEDKITDKVLRLLEDAAVYEEVPAAEPEKE